MIGARFTSIVAFRTADIAVRLLHSETPPEVGALFAELDADLAARYPAPPRWRPNSIGPAVLRRTAAPIARRAPRRQRALLLAYWGDECVGCAALFDDGHSTHLELGRMYLMPELRGRGIADLLLHHAELAAAGLGYPSIRLETGSRQPEAVHVYLRNGYAPRRRWGRYRGNVASQCYEKRVSSVSA